MQARESLKAGQRDEALTQYDVLIKSRQHISEVIDDLNNHLSLSPLDIQTWVCLGDAYLHIDKLESALEAYNKAEELLR
jgi:cytochrome c-type biogenesis protein CcmH/NrfG